MKLLSEKLQEQGIAESASIKPHVGCHVKIIGGEFEGHTGQVTSLYGGRFLVKFHESSPRGGSDHSDYVRTEYMEDKDLEVVTDVMVSESADYGGDPHMEQLKDMFIEFAEDLDPFENVPSGDGDTVVDKVSKSKMGYVYSDRISLSYIQGRGMTLGDRKTQNIIEQEIEKVLKSVKEDFVKKHKDVFGSDGELVDLVNSDYLYGDLQERGKDELAEELSEMEQEALGQVNLEFDLEVSTSAATKESGKGKVLLTYHVGGRQISTPYAKQLKFKDMDNFILQAGNQLDYVKKYI